MRLSPGRLEGAVRPIVGLFAARRAELAGHAIREPSGNANGSGFTNRNADLSRNFLCGSM
jgi:hypothetical protein